MSLELPLETFERREGIESKRKVAGGILKITRPKLLERRHLADGLVKLRRGFAAGDTIDVFLINEYVRYRRLLAGLLVTGRAQRVLELPFRTGHRNSTVDPRIIPERRAGRKRRPQSRP